MPKNPDPKRTIPPEQLTRPGLNGGRLNNGPGPGRPKGATSIRTEIRRQLAQDGGKKLKQLVSELIEQAAKGNVVALREIIRQAEDNGADLLELRGSVETTSSNGTPDPGLLTDQELATYIRLKRKMTKPKDADEESPNG